MTESVLQIKELGVYAIVSDSGQQFKVSEGQTILVDERSVEVGESIQFDRVLLYAAGDDVRVGTPRVEDVTVGGEVMRRVKGDKVIVFKRKRRKGARTKHGHRQQYLEVLIREIKAN